MLINWLAAEGSGQLIIEAFLRIADVHYIRSEMWEVGSGKVEAFYDLGGQVPNLTLLAPASRRS